MAMTTFELGKEFITSKQYKVIKENSDEGLIAFRYQLNTINFHTQEEDEHFFYLNLPLLFDEAETNIAQVKENCHKLNSKNKLVKFYTNNKFIVASAEMFYLSKRDFMFQIKNALKYLVASKVAYKKLEAKV